MKGIKASLLPAALMGTMVIGSGLATTASAQDPYTVGVEASFPPWAYVEGGEFKGIAIDAMEAIAEEVGIEIEFQDMPFPSLIPALAAEKIDILATGLTVTEERSENIDFTIPWWETNDVVLVPEDSDLNVFTAVCCGARVGVQGGSSQQAWMEENVVNSSDIDVELAKYDNYVTAVDDMAIGRISSVIVDDTSAQEYINSGKPVKMAGKIYIRAPLALAVSKDDPQEILGDLNQGILAIYESGEWGEIVDEYIPGVTVPAIPGHMPDFVDTYQKPVAGLPELGNE
ncbi:MULTISPECIES: ABC transporter substrate-binding protein [Halomonas]|uniref:Amino acid ABC transporter substrate-binding protein (PAAT family) n=1 Tax=Halomonas ventosae TaxID=229007 RepID=A0A4R6ZLT5_9GAMM|nr:MULTISPECIES: ABC transporter substrate-binding protein [Halomonas]MDW7745933.1 ABC transporter substrate-binding protein [Halomonas sp.]TDR53305.1 amino acid ABC transporter substrate-binding protein (PAAT family) [Halomonas ventosae]WFM71927.1 ABC transporter substrate-binding protein [Halomonas sp. CKK8]